MNTSREVINEAEVEHKVYKRRWTMLLLFTAFVFNGVMQWTQFTIISNITSKYYDATSTQLEYTALVFTIANVVFIVPSIYIIDYMGVRNTMILSGFGVALGAWIKIFSVDQDKFILVIIGQIFCASALMFPFGLYGRIPALWFGIDEISTAGVIAMLGDELGAAAGFFLPPLFVKDGTIGEIENGLTWLNWFMAASSTIIFILILFLFESKPEFPPSIAQVKKRQMSETHSSWQDILGAMKKTPTQILLLVYFTLGPYTAILTKLNDIISANFPNDSAQSGYIGCLMMISGTIASLITARVLDTTRKYKIRRYYRQIGIFLTVCLTISMACFTWTLKSNNLSYVYIASAFIGVFNVSFYAAGFQVGLELSYPLSEVVFTAAVGIAVESGALVVTVIYGYALQYVGDLLSNVGLTLLYLVSAILLMLVPNDMHRTAAEKLPIKREPTYI